MEKMQERILKGQCFNNACVLYSAILSKEVSVNAEDVIFIFSLAEKLYNQAIEIKWTD